MMDRTTRWQQTWQQLGMPLPPQDVFEALLAGYREPRRHYHTLQHLDECFANFDRLVDEGPHPGEIALALWYHDAVYDAQRNDNEARSSEMARDCLRAAGAGAAVIDRVDALIMSTRHHVPEGDPDRAVLIDVDLAILGSTPERFAEYERQIRAEYAHVPDALYREKRREVLEGYLGRSRIFATQRFHDAYEEKARENLRASLRASTIPQQAA
ncbi:hypothetical protein HH212_22395 [Massilia forsythiae]|uniref:N-methyl-D-aspartate receptor NMDAR2C subunit n=1 Tax=Massilia forsythiae TaxID=2728020 RepID=A0A7Z2VZS4_9BURK|nr:hypothetical protein [Massilia forsythiae]QJE02432.1 hypothetical protein HH212_22395 [Massilia forsythiae]